MNNSLDQLIYISCPSTTVVINERTYVNPILVGHYVWGLDPKNIAWSVYTFNINPKSIAIVQTNVLVIGN